MTADHELPVAGTVVVLRPAPEGFEVLLMRRPERGSFAGAWVFPGGKVEPGDHMQGADEADDARRAGVREVAEEVGLDVDDLVVVSRWEPPAEAPVRIRTWFFLALAPSQEVRASSQEVAEAVWIAPADALARHAAGEWRLFPPTWVTLHGLCGFADAESALAAGGQARAFRTVIDGTVFSWESGRLETAELPWVFSPVSPPASG
ncbi:NUDIX domain-containing protein [Streptomyces sp. AC495_CC817]|uniref:NUDIX hydrolase n=1 Tax=Streptomyces sp. AC495_CC817 TaxID=2823900 RepID=UPI001C27085B|nr:NUDIX domain-containing protein [Streptomyces sp. AC495_CC817]